MEWTRDEYLISTDPARLDREVIWEFLHTSYWASGVAREAIEASLEHALCFGLYAGEQQIGFARVVTDQVRFAWLSDVFVLEAHRGRGLGVWLVETVLAHPHLTQARVLLATADAHGVYERFGFERTAPGRMMERRAP